MRHKKRTIHKYKNRTKPRNKHNKTRKNPVRNRSKQASRKYTSPHRKTMKMRGGSDLLSKAYDAVQTGLSVFGPRATEPDTSSRQDIMDAHMAQMIEFPLPNKKFTYAEYARMIEFQKRFIQTII